MKDFQLLDQGWPEEFKTALGANPSHLQIVCPFIKTPTALRFIEVPQQIPIKVITKFDLNCFNRGVSDLEALKLFLSKGAEIKGVKGLHSKLYLFGQDRAIATSANLTESAMHRNHEFGFKSTDVNVIKTCDTYFQNLWNNGGNKLTSDQILDWERRLEEVRKDFQPSENLPDFGTAVNLNNPLTESNSPLASDHQSFVKFFGRSSDRSSRQIKIAEVIKSSGCHWACTYPKSKPPRQVKNGDRIFMGRLVRDENDIMIFGYAVGREHNDDLDFATDIDIEKRPWKARWPRYVRVHSGSYLNARLGEGVSLNQLMDTLGAQTYTATARNSKNDDGNTSPTRAMMRKAHMQITPQANQWLIDQLEAKFQKFGKLALRDLGS